VAEWGRVGRGGAEWGDFDAETYNPSPYATIYFCPRTNFPKIFFVV
jgi:hypothetical protein